MAIKNNTNAVLAEARRLAKEKLILATLKVERTAKETGYCPVLTGTARRSITHEIAPNGKSAKVGSNVDYFPHIEIGTKYMSARAPLRRALETCMPWIKKLFGAR